MYPDEHGSRRGPEAPPARILVLDDEPMIRHFVSRALEAAGYEVVVLSPPFRAVQLLADAHFDLVITNSMMPAVGGAQLVAQIRKEFPDVPVIHMDDQSHPVPPEFPTDVPRLDKPFSNDTLLREVAQRLPDLSAARDPASWHIVATDDDPKLLAQVTYTLRDAGHIVYAAYNGFIALQQAMSTPDLDLLITNTRLRGLDAPELIRRVREARPNLPILHIGDPLPVDEFTRNVPSLGEPVTAEALLEEIAALLGR